MAKWYHGPWVPLEPHSVSLTIPPNLTHFVIPIDAPAPLTIIVGETRVEVAAEDMPCAIKVGGVIVDIVIQEGGI